MKAGWFTICRLVPALFLVAVARGQQPIGTVGVQDATVAGSLEVTNGRAVLVGSTTVTAREHTAEVTLSRGGEIRVCATSGLHVTAGKSAEGTMPLMLALDRGAIEVHMSATANDVVMTPDLRFSMRVAGPLDLRIRVAPNGDTCVENRGGQAPALNIADQFGEASYVLLPDQHVLFEHGSLKEVVDHESSPCGCPPDPVVSVADGGNTSATPAAPGAAVSTKAVEEEHPFPAAISDGLAPGSAVPQAEAVHAQVTTTMSYGTSESEGGTGAPHAAASAPSGAGAGAVPIAPVPSAAPATTATAVAPVETTAQAPPPPPAPAPHGVFHSIGRFFKRLFGG
ncbi:nuclease [Edaphobacter bradus]|uniref:nuclease n=1 Tax=Edaphobacter bradus TaxID=2259016 RepID=UPI0021DF61C4|nr:nuclease [Edaphobacter bradus]